MESLVIYPGTFDPVTNGHLDLMKRALGIFDSMIVAVASNPRKNPLFSLKERVGFIKDATKKWKNITVEPFGNLLIDFIKIKRANVIIKGIRAVSDFEYEFQLALMNRRLDSSIETIYMNPSEEFSFISSRIIKEVSSLNGNIDSMVPEGVSKGLKEKFQNKAV